MKIHFKLYAKIGNNVEIKRFALNDENSYDLNFLTNHINGIFNNIKISKLSYKDADEDFIKISSSDELREALNLNDEDTFRLYLDGEYVDDVDYTDVEKGSDVIMINEENNTVYHPNVLCDGCDGHIYGTRYKCSICYDFDLCSKCETEGKHTKNHPFLKINLPASYNNLKKFENKQEKKIHNGGNQRNKSTNYSIFDYSFLNSFDKILNGTLIPNISPPPPPPPPYFGPPPSYYHQNFPKFSSPLHTHEEQLNSSSTNNSNTSNENDLNNNPHLFWSALFKNLSQSFSMFFDPLGVDVNFDFEDKKENGVFNVHTNVNNGNKNNENSFNVNTNFKFDTNKATSSNTSSTTVTSSSVSTSTSMVNDMMTLTPSIRISVNGQEIKLPTSTTANEDSVGQNLTQSLPEIIEDLKSNISQMVIDEAKSEKNTNEVEVIPDSNIAVIVDDIFETGDADGSCEEDLTIITDNVSENYFSDRDDIPKSFDWDLIDKNEIKEKGENEKSTLQETLTKLEEMGYVDEGGWLTNLIIVKNYDLTKVLNAIHPN